METPTKQFFIHYDGFTTTLFTKDEIEATPDEFADLVLNRVDVMTQVIVRKTRVEFETLPSKSVATKSVKKAKKTVKKEVKVVLKTMPKKKGRPFSADTLAKQKAEKKRIYMREYKRRTRAAKKLAGN